MMEDKKLLREGAKLGVSLGILMIVLTILPMYYYASSSSFWMVIIGPMITGFLIPLIISVIFTFNLRKRIGGFWTFRQAVSGIFAMFLVAVVLSSIAGFVYEKYVAPDMREHYMRNIENNTITYLENAGVDAEQIDAQVEKIDQEIEKAGDAGIVDTFRGLLISVLVVFVIALIFGALFKKEKPIFNVIDSDPTV
ncbi:hypothetical protein GCM10023231_18830 [Olivibacter ginsenosidimutans]|uniref:DUF4199 domain-containing protein n=1 Tax=Olivibacter ginsenosidimutans TaxID=1176537 RepID=A0ABP9B9L1_9SPHI